MIQDSGEAIVELLSLVFLVILPGWTLYNLIGAPRLAFRSRLVIQIALGLLLMSFVGLGLSWAGLVNSLWLDLIYGAIGTTGVVLWSKKHHSGIRSTGRSFLRNILSRRLGLVLLPYILGIVVWWSYIGAHTADAGLHAFWSGWVASNGRLPNYSVAGPSVPSAILVFGPHLLLAAISLVSNSPTTSSFWVPLLFLYLSILLSIQAITLQIMRSETASTFASLFYVASQIPAARILLGNLPDLTGYFLISAVVLGMITASGLKSITITASIASSIIVYYQYALLTLAILTGFFGATLLFRRVFRGRGGNPSVPIHWQSMIAIVIFAGEIVLFASQVSYLNGGSVALLRATRWQPASALEYVSNLGNVALFFTGIIGLPTLFWSGSKGNTFGFRGGALIASWAVAVSIASLGPFVGVGVEPIRFIWHLVEPFAIASGVFLARVLAAIFNGRNNLVGHLRVTLRTPSISERTRYLSKVGVTSILLVTVIVVPSLISAALSPTPEPFFRDDIAIGQWLTAHARSDSGIAVNSDVDSSATWVQAYSLRPRFFYKSNYAISVSAAPYAQTYQDIAFLFNNPNTLRASTITQAYNITYIVVPRPEFQVFSMANQYFLQVYASPSGDITVFSPNWATQP